MVSSVVQIAGAALIVLGVGFLFGWAVGAIVGGVLAGLFGVAMERGR